MIRKGLRKEIYDYVQIHPEGVSLNELMAKYQRDGNRLQVRTLMDGLARKNLITLIRLTEKNSRVTKYFPYNGQPYKQNKRTPKQVITTRRMLDMRDFWIGGYYCAFIFQPPFNTESWKP